MTATDDEARARAAAAVRRIGHALIAHQADVDVMIQLAERGEALAVELEARPPRQRDSLHMKEQMFPGEIPEGEEIHHFDECFVSGRHNPLGIGVSPRRVGDEVVADVTLGAAFEGAPGRAHGGIVAAIFDDVLGYLLTLNQIPAFTGELTVRYLAATPINEPLEIRSRLLQRDGRRIFCEAEATGAEGRIATATATFIEVEPSRFRP